ncbi:hypothetical protein HOF56_03030 [Candidatus Peribacteria bacterium]|jgi:hypothetical protein|nr:hypothetical protein [Candidatus Peribacteria bacterium]MBT4021541.1 hypothetical protein [Candidatus Peribacteria bacterium]MBT4240634.1 hypothetical protein [Candidatus Peribacteria bacterium]MBT4474640.1 hypothetical protein [Candidatus Peribacteria bacterium]
MKKLITILAFVLFLVPSITLAATYEVEVTAADPLERSLHSGMEITHDFTIENKGTKADTYDLQLISEMGWGVENDLPAAVSISSEYSATIPVKIFISKSVNPNARGGVTLKAISRNDHINATHSATLFIQVEGAVPTPSIDGPSSGETGERLYFTLMGIDEGSFIKSRGFNYEIDWEGTGKANEVITGRADGTNANHIYTRAGEYTIIVNAIDRTYQTSKQVTQEIVITGEDTVSPTRKRQASHLHSANPCTGKKGLSLHACMNSIRKENVPRANISDRRDIRAARILNRNSRANMLKERARSRNKLSPFEIYRENINGRTDSRSAEERLHSASGDSRTKTLRSISERRRALRSQTVDLKKSQSASGNRKTATKAPVCVRRDGIRLINCLLDNGIEINRWTADEETIEIWKKLNTELTE